MEVPNKEWHDWFHAGESPYYAMFKAGIYGIPLEDVAQHIALLGIPLREKDVHAWEDGDWKRRVKAEWKHKRRLDPRIYPENPMRMPSHPTLDKCEVKLKDYAEWPENWRGTDKRWFPCTADNRPMQRWGYSEMFTPTLYERHVAQGLSPYGWVGQNLYAQPFIVIDIDGVGHGQTDEQVIAFGSQFKSLTETWEDPTKVGSFHLYFSTNKIIPIQHYLYARCDIMGNEKNAAVYSKNKISNGIPRMMLDDAVWEELCRYVRIRKRQRDCIA